MIVIKCKIILTLLFCCYLLQAQVADEVRLGYSEMTITSKQVGMAASPDGNHIAFAYEDKTVKIFDVFAGKFIKRFVGPYTDLVDLHLLSDGRIILISRQEVQIFDWKSGKGLVTFPLSQAVSKTTCSEKNNLLAVGQYEGFVTLIDIDKLVQLRMIQYKKDHISALAINPDGKTIVIGAQGAGIFPNPLKLFDIASGQELAQSKNGVFTMVTFSRDGKLLIAGGRMGGATYKVVTVLMDTRNLAILRHIRSKRLGGPGPKQNIPFGAYLSSDRVMLISDTQSFDVLDKDTGAELFTTMREQGNIGKTSLLGVGSFNVFPLNEAGDKVIVNTTKNNINQIYDSKKNAMVGYFFSDSNDDFAIVSRDGRIEGTPGALSKLYWTSRRSNKKTALESGYEKGFTPRLLSQIVGENTSQQIAFEVDDVLGKIPVIELKSISAKSGRDSSSFESIQKMIKLEIEVKQSPGEVTSLKLFQNSKLIKTLSNEGKPIYTFDVSLNNSFGEENYFFVTAGSKSGIDSEKIKFRVFYKGASEARPRLFLVTIGINQYKNPKYNLNYAQADADGVYQAIHQKSATLFQEIVPFTIRNDSASKANIFSALEEIKSTSLEQDMLILYYAGHGVMSEGGGREKEFFIVPHDVTQLYGRDELLYEKAISANELRTITQQINAQKQVFILDACQSSGALEAIESRNRGVAEEKAIAQLARSTGTFWITSTGTDQFASEFEKLGHGIFTYALLEGIQGAADTNDDQRLTIRELSTYIENKVPELSEQLKGSPQYPSAYSFGNDFPLIVYKK